MGDHGNELLVACFGPLVGAEQARLRRSVDVGVDNSDPLAEPGQGDREVGRHGRLSDPTLATADRDQARPLTSRGGQCDPDHGDAVEVAGESIEPGFERCPGGFVEAACIDHEGRGPFAQTGTAKAVAVRT